MKNFIVTDRVELELATMIRSLGVDRLFVLVDENTAGFCLSRIDLSEFNPFVIKIKAGDEGKTIDTAVGIWNELVDVAVKNGLNVGKVSMTLNEEQNTFILYSK